MMPSTSCRCTSARRGFTLIEVLVAVAVMALMLGMLGQMIASIRQASQGGQAKVDNFTRGRIAMYIICDDLKRGIYNRPDLPLPFSDANQSFYTQRQGYPGSGAGKNPRQISLVSYVTNASGTSNTLTRYDTEADWDSLANIAFSSTDLPTPSHANSMVSNVVGFTILYMGTNGILHTTYDPTNGLAGFAVGLALIDQKSAARMPSSQITVLTQAFDTGSSITNGIRAYWENNVPWASISALAPGGLKIFERYVILP